MANGQLLLAGGDQRDKGYNLGIRDTTRFKPANNALSAAAPMRSARWYASQTVLANGDVLVLGGSNDQGGASITPELGTPCGADRQQSSASAA